jgi:hypothetical protein
MRGVVRDVPGDVKSGLTFKSLVVSLGDNTIWCPPSPQNNCNYGGSRLPVANTTQLGEVNKADTVISFYNVRVYSDYFFSLYLVRRFRYIKCGSSSI